MKKPNENERIYRIWGWRKIADNIIKGEDKTKTEVILTSDTKNKIHEKEDNNKVPQN